MENIKKLFFIALFLLLGVLIACTFSSCEISKKAVKSKKSSELIENIITKTKRIGDTVSFIVPKIKLKDTTIYTFNRVGTRIETRYNSDGQIDLIECMSSSIDEMKEENRRLIESIKDKDKEKTEKVSANVILYGFIGLGLLVVIVMFGFSRMFKKQLDAVTGLIPKK